MKNNNPLKYPGHTDNDLLNLLQEDDLNALQRLFFNYHPSLCSTAYQILQNKNLAKDVVQEAFILLWKSRKNLPAINQLNLYLKTAVIQGAIKLLKEKFTIDKFKTDDIESIIESNRDIFFKVRKQEELYKRGIEYLPPALRATFCLSRYEGLSNAEIAENLGISVKAVEKYIYNALDILNELGMRYS